MLDTTADKLSNYLLTILPAGSPHPRRELEALPGPIADYLGSVLDRRADQKASAPNSPWLDESAEMVQTARKVWRTAARAAAQFPEGAWTKAVRTASRQVLSYLVAPVDTLASFAYTDAATELGVEALQERMAAFTPYPYFREVAEGYVARKALAAIDRSEFEKLLKRIDRRMVASYGASDWMALLEPLFRLISSIPEHADGVPAGLLQQFFEAKGFADLASKLEDGQAYDKERLLNVLIRSAMDAPATTDKDAAVSTEVAASESAKPDLEAQVATAENGPEPIWQRLARDKAAATSAVVRPDGLDEEIDGETSTGDDGETADDRAISGKSLATRDDVESGLGGAEEVSDAEILEEFEDVEDGVDAEIEAKEEAPEDRNAGAANGSKEDVPEQRGAGEVEPIWKKYASRKPVAKPRAGRGTAPSHALSRRPAATDRPEPLRDLEQRVLGPTATERRDWYAGYLTGGSEAAYRAVLEELDRAPNWHEAWPILKNAFQANKVEIYSDAIVAFTDAVEGRFTS